MLDMCRLSALFAHRLVSVIRKYLLISSPEVAEGAVSLVLGWDTFPEFAAGLFATIADDIGHNLASAATQTSPSVTPATLGVIGPQPPRNTLTVYCCPFPTRLRFLGTTS